MRDIPLNFQLLPYKFKYLFFELLSLYSRPGDFEVTIFSCFYLKRYFVKPCIFESVFGFEYSSIVRMKS